VHEFTIWFINSRTARQLVHQDSAWIHHLVQNFIILRVASLSLMAWATRACWLSAVICETLINQV
jgi:hypothetical protein